MYYSEFYYGLMYVLCGRIYSTVLRPQVTVEFNTVFILEESGKKVRLGTSVVM
jgi:hypothetical protein